jgi:pyruvate/2-oxoacid:ferredoxin oxidoreductase beta subunit
MDTRFLKDIPLPFCKGCGHSRITQTTERVLTRLGAHPLDVILVTDIGCHGIIDKCFQTHTVHGLHGRSIALAAGITAGLSDPAKKVIVFIGDGGATIGIQHLIDCAHHNLDMTVVVHNNMLYGMTGGQPSEFTPPGFKTPAHQDRLESDPVDICALATAAGAAFVTRVDGTRDFSDELSRAFSKRGFSLVEVMELCPGYGTRSNPGVKLATLIEEAGLAPKTYVDREDVVIFKPKVRRKVASLIDRTAAVKTRHRARVDSPMHIVVSGSAGEGVQFAAELFCLAAIASGLQVTKKGSYPVTVGTGFSSAELIISPNEILYTGSPVADLLIITSEDGLHYAAAAAERMASGTILIDRSLEAPSSGAEIVPIDARSKAGGKNAAIYSLLLFLRDHRPFPVAAMLEAIDDRQVAGKLDWKSLLSC